MACNDQNTDCAPCQDCPPSIPPVLPRCQDIALIDGVYLNATVVVSQGCIVQVAAGEAMAYQPDVCCPTGGGGGEDGLMGPAGPQGSAATVAIGTVTSVAPAAPPTVVNSGTPSNAIFNFQIPQGQPGVDGASPTGVTQTTGVWEFEDGFAKVLPPDFPPINTLTPGTSDIPGLSLIVTKDPVYGSTTLDINGAGFYNFLLSTIAGLQADITALTGEAAWGGVTGTLSAQLDLWGALMARPRWFYSELAPATPNTGDKWFRISTQVESVYINDGVNPPFWVALN